MKTTQTTYDCKVSGEVKEMRDNEKSQVREKSVHFLYFFPEKNTKGAGPQNMNEVRFFSQFVFFRADCLPKKYT